MTDLWNYLKTAEKTVVLYGMGNGADKIIAILQKYGIKVSGIFATDGFVRDKEFHGLKLETYSALKERFGDMIVLMCFGSARREVIENVRRIAAEQEFYAPDVPVFGNTLFNSDFVMKNRGRFEKIYELLVDDISKKTFENTIRYKLSGDINYLFDCEVSQNEPYESFLTLGNDEIYADLGAYRGDTVADFLSRTNGYKHIYAVEPDRKTFAKLLIKTDDIKDITCVNACISDIGGEKLFSMSGSRGSALENGGAPVPAVTGDEILSKWGATFIKTDIEGAEAEAVRGLKNTILGYKPKMQIACYHRSEDLFSIPDEVLSIRDDYKIYMRHFYGLPSWDTNFYFI